MRILFITPYPTGEAPSQRFRFEQYFSTLKKRGHTYTVSSFLSYGAWGILYKHGYTFRKIIALISGYLRRIFDLFRLHKFDAVFIHREASPFGPPWFEWFVTRIFKKYTIYDFDDAIWIPNASETNRNLTMLFKRFNNAIDICRWCSVVSVGNAYLAEFASKYNDNVIINPTTIDTDGLHNIVSSHDNSEFVIGWTGSHSTVQYLDELFPVLKKLEEKHRFKFHVIGDVPPKFNLKSMNFIPWKKLGEIDELAKFDVGVMPLPEDVWAKGKCGFKALQYMALGIPALVSDVGVNAEIVDHNINGFVCTNTEEWYSSLNKLMSDPTLLKQMSEKTREKIVKKYSVDSNKENFLNLFDGFRKTEFRNRNSEVRNQRKENGI
jgi:glycosyltransferase involved in cell wall biosynthesis